MARPLDALPLDRAAAMKIVRAALAREVELVPLAEPPQGDGACTLRLALPDGVSLSLRAEPAGAAAGDAHPLRLAPIDEAHARELRAWVEDDDLGPLSKSASAIFDTSPPLPSSGAGLPPSTERAAVTLRDFPAGAAGAEAMAPTQARPSAPFSAAPETPTDPIFPAGLLARGASDEPLAPSIASVRSARPRRGGGGGLARGRVVGGKYEIDSLVGSGAVGAVYKAAHSELARTVAIKVLHPVYRSDAQLMRAFRAEARSASRLQHPNVTVVHDFGEDPDGLVYIVMEYLEGRTVQALLDAEGALPAARAARIMMQVCAALAAAHEWGIVHRDVKPDNVVLVATRDDDDGAPRELVKVCDFGIAALEGAPRSTPGFEEELTAGTPEYMAPEQIAGRYDARTDVYACGIVLYEMLTGVVPFTGPSVRATLDAHARLAPQRPSAVDPRISPELEALVLRAIEKRPDLRFASMRELRSELKRFI